MKASQYIVRQGEKAQYSCLLISGFAVRHKLAGDGARSINAVHMKGDMVDLQNSLLDVADHNVQTLTNCEVAFIPREAVLQLAFQFPKVGMALWYDTLVDASIFRQWILNVTRHDAGTRVAHLLCEFGLRLEYAELGTRTSYDLPMTQEQLADSVGLTSVHVNRTLKDLERRGLIRRNVRSVGVVDWAHLAKAADFSSAYLHLPSQKRQVQSQVGGTSLTV
jgi:CRP-like cAMP-binding protein